MELHCRQRIIAFPRRPLVMGIVNVNDDSFCGDGTLDISKALQQAMAMVTAGADIIDVGAESARTNREAIRVDEEIGRLVPFIRAFQETGWPEPLDSHQVWPPLLSINTWRPEVVGEVLRIGGDLLNDIGALPDAKNAISCATHEVALLIMHSVGLPKVAHTHIGYENVMTSLDAFFTEKIALAKSAGLTDSQIIIDPGVDFAKQKEDNLRIFADVGRLHRFGVPVLLPISRKSVIGQVLDLPDPLERDAGTVACLVAGLRQGVQLFRVHNVQAAVQAIQTLAWLDAG